MPMGVFQMVDTMYQVGIWFVVALLAYIVLHRGELYESYERELRKKIMERYR
jgi:hypothetical protein